MSALAQESTVHRRARVILTDSATAINGQSVATAVVNANAKTKARTK